MPIPWSEWPRSSLSTVHRFVVGAISDGISHFHERRVAPSGIVVGRVIADLLSAHAGHGRGWSMLPAAIYGLPVRESIEADNWGPSMFPYGEVGGAEESCLLVEAGDHGLVRSGLRVRDIPAQLMISVDVISHHGRRQTLNERYVSFLLRIKPAKMRTASPLDLWLG